MFAFCMSLRVCTLLSLVLLCGSISAVRTYVCKQYPTDHVAYYISDVTVVTSLTSQPLPHWLTRLGRDVYLEMSPIKMFSAMLMYLHALEKLAKQRGSKSISKSG